MNTRHYESQGGTTSAGQLPQFVGLQPPPPSIQTRLHTLLASESAQNQSLLTARASMSTLGAQARAAEYAAATAARARQVTRDAEDQKLPPKAAPISLSAFTKTQSSNRNKGPKAWKPLNLDDMLESSDEGLADRDSGRVTPTPTERTAMSDRMASLSKKRAPSGRIDTINVDIPTAPRAMINASAPTTSLTNNSPRRERSQPTVNLPKLNYPHDYYSTSSPFHHGGIPYPAFQPFQYSREMQCLGTPPNDEAAYSYRFGCMMVPDDISPAKQEDKFAMLSQIEYPADSFVQHEPLANITPHTFQSQDDTLRYGFCNNAGIATASRPYGWDISSHDGNYSEYNAREQPYQGHVSYVEDEDEEHADCYSTTTTSAHTFGPLPDNTSPPDYAQSGHCAQSSRLPYIAVGSGRAYRRELLQPSDVLPDSRGPSYAYEKPYDRRSTMERFKAVATQEALARKGKTVLHNPDLHKTITSKAQSENRDLNNQDSLPINFRTQIISLAGGQKRFLLVPWTVEPRQSADTCQVVSTADGQKDVSKLVIPSGLSLDELEVVANAINNPAPGLDFPQFESRGITTDDPINGGTPNLHLDLVDQVGSNEWSRLRPSTSVDRSHVRACMTKAAADLTTPVPQPGVFGNMDGFSVRDGGLSHTERWFCHDGRGEQAAREELLTIASKHASMCRASAKEENGGKLPVDYKLGVEDGFAANIILGEVVANLQSYSLGDKKSVEQRRNFHKVKSVPEFAMERGGVLSALGLPSDSYFDDEQSGFQGAPVRIARDPRFRPQGNEGLKLKPEEEWKNRHEMYGRRVM